VPYQQFRLYRFLRKITTDQIMSCKNQPRRTAYRDSGNGQFITKREAERRPQKEVEKERIRVGKK